MLPLPCYEIRFESLKCVNSPMFAPVGQWRRYNKAS